MLRVTQRTMYSTLTNQMNGNLSAYMESNIQGSTMKKVNKPSDDPAGMARILNYRTSIERITQLEVSSDTALGWLQLADTTLTNSVSTLLVGEEPPRRLPRHRPLTPPRPAFFRPRLLRDGVFSFIAQIVFHPEPCGRSVPFLPDCQDSECLEFARTRVPCFLREHEAGVHEAGQACYSLRVSGCPASLRCR